MRLSSASSLLAFFGVFLLALLVLYGPILAGAALYFRDVLHNYYPQLSFFKDSILKGDLPFWNPYLFNGTPQMAGLEPPLFYPLGWMFFFLPFQLALALNLCLHHMIAAIGILALGGQYRWSWAARTLAASCFSLGGVMIAMNNFHPLQNTVAWIPVLFWAAHCILSEKQPRALFWFSLAYALQILSGHLEIVYFTSLLLLLYTGLFVKQKGRHVVFLGAAIALGILMAALQWVPTLLYLPLSVRQGGLENFNSSVWSYHPLLSSMFILPEHNGNIFSGLGLYMILGEPRFSHVLFFVSSYMGILAWLGLGMVLWRLPSQTQRCIVIFWLGVLVLSCLMAYGSYLPFYQLASHLPGMNFFRYPSKFLILVALAFAVLTGWGFDAIEDNPKHLKQLLKLTLCLGISFGLAGFILLLMKQGFTAWLSQQIQMLRQMAPERAAQWGQKLPEQLLTQIGRQVLFCFTLIGICYLALQKHWKPYVLMAVLLCFSLLDLLMSGVNAVWLTSGEIMETKSPIGEFLASRQLQQNKQERYQLANNVSLVPPIFREDISEMFYFRPNLFQKMVLEDNYGLIYGFHNAYGIWPAHTHLSNLYYLLYQEGATNSQIQLRNVLESQSAVRYLILPNPSPSLLSLYEQSDFYSQLKYFPELNSYVFENQNYLPRARFYYQSAALKDEKLITSAFANPDAFNFKIKEQVLLLDDAALQQARRLVASEEATIKRWSQPEIIHESNNRVDIVFETNTSGYLTLADQYISGWKAYDNGQETPVLRANFFHRAVRVGPGKHQIRFEYHPPGLLTGLITSVVAGLLWLILLLYLNRKKSAVQADSSL